MQQAAAANNMGGSFNMGNLGSKFFLNIGYGLLILFFYILHTHKSHWKRILVVGEVLDYRSYVRYVLHPLAFRAGPFLSITGSLPATLVVGMCLKPFFLDSGTLLLLCLTSSVVTVYVKHTGTLGFLFVPLSNSERPQRKKAKPPFLWGSHLKRVVPL